MKARLAFAPRVKEITLVIFFSDEREQEDSAGVPSKYNSKSQQAITPKQKYRLTLNSERNQKSRQASESLATS